MNRQLLLMRHGKSDWRVDADDFDRPLKTRGKRGAQRMGVWLLQQNLVPDYIISSPAERASNTAAKLTKAMGLTRQHIHYDARIYEADIEQLQAVLADCPAHSHRVLLVGHNPGLEELLLHLHGSDIERPEDGKLLPTATLAVLKMPEDWSELKPGTAKLTSITRASTLSETFPFNGIAGLEQRLRPAYYYSQSAVIPYRIKNSELQLLLISSSGKNHWVVPKGIIEPGCSAHASAANEAWEEAGVRGIVSEQMLGCYQYQKWGGTCTVQVFPMLVTDFIGDREWEESHRHREWFTLKKATLLIEQQPLQAMFAALAAALGQGKN
ncbi:histidine phosphatase family protein [Methylomarinum vadi]|uniref:histidine phosphatase family protein n=1 Tax=Methylomarinum vadi TaxID=438855 RepID=UPI000AA7C2F4|nr:histidine phosphatase family protein [Methylomarinum vadi]